MKYLLIKGIITLLFVVLYSTTFSASIVAGELSYSSTQTPGVFNVKVKVYRSCSGSQICSSCPGSIGSGCKSLVKITGVENQFASVLFDSTWLQAVAGSSGFDVVQLCNMSKSICTNCGTRTAGTFSPGIEIYVFEGLVNLNSIPSACCKIRLSYSGNFRNAEATTYLNPSLTPFYQEAILNRCVSPSNSSPVYGNDPVIVACTGKSNYFPMKASDPDGDSISFEKAPLLSDSNQSVSYIHPYSPIVPFPYLGMPIQSPPALPPVGFYMLPSNGDIGVTPLGVFSSSMRFLVKEWKYSGGHYEIAGITSREIAVISINCPANDAPVNYLYSANGGPSTAVSQNNFSLSPGVPFCLIVSSKDRQVADTTDINLSVPAELKSTGYSELRFYNPATRTLNGPVSDSLKFCWTPQANQIRTKPYVIEVMSSDRACPLPSRSYQYINLNVQGGSSGFQEKADKDLFEVYPNPSHTTISVQLKKPLQDKVFVEVLGIDGKQVRSGWLMAGEMNTHFNVQGLYPGVYFVRLKGNGIESSSKLVIDSN